MSTTRRGLMAAASLTAIGGNSTLAQSFAFTPNQRYPDPAVLILDPSFAKYRIYSSTVEQVATGMRWAVGPVYFPGSDSEGGHVLVSDMPNNRIMKFDERTGAFTVFRANANWANGNARDRQGRLITGEHSVTRRVTRTERLQPAGQGHRLHQAARALRQPVFRRAEEQPPVHGKLPLAVCAVRGIARRHLN